MLSTLSEEDWSQPTVCGVWTVKDVAAHLLGGNLSRLWPHREASTGNALSFELLTAEINRRNDEWVHAARRISPEMLIEMLKLTDHRLYQHFRSLDPSQPAWASVVWAGENQSPIWFDIAREYTEKWLHQQHIREAVGQLLLIQPRWLHPVLDIFLRALPYAYRDVEVGEGDVVLLRITGRAGGSWSLRRLNGSWQLLEGTFRNPISTVTMDSDTAWRLFTKGLDQDQARLRVQIDGDDTIGSKTLETIAIMA